MMSLHLNKDDEIAYLREQVRYRQGILDKMMANPAPWAIVYEIRGAKTAILTGTQLIEVPTPTHIKIEPCCRVHVDQKTCAIIDRIDGAVVTGDVQIVKHVVDDRHVEIATGGQGRLALYHGTKPEDGDRVILDPTNSVVLRNLGPESKNKDPIFTGVDWDDIGGQAEAKRLLIEAIEGPFLDSGLHKAYGSKRIKGAVLAGPPRTGKTLLGKAVATALARMFGAKSTASGFQSVKGPELLNMWTGNSEANARKLFVNAKAHKKEHGYPGVIFLDEGDALLGRRDTPKIHGIEQTMVPTFLVELDGIEDSSAIVLVATNRPHALDPAITGDGRLDLKIYVGRPSKEDAVDIFSKHLRGVPLDGMTMEEACRAGADHLFDGRHALYVVRTKSGTGDKRFTLGELVNGGMCEGLVKRAVLGAIRRDKAAGRTEPSGVSRSDLGEAANVLCAEQRILEHGPEVQEFIESHRLDVRSVEEVKP